MGRSSRRHRDSRRDEESDYSYSDSRSRSRSRSHRRSTHRRSERRNHSSRYDRRRDRSRSPSVESTPVTQENKISDDYFPKATVTEVGGEISCSIEETNRIRAELGLPPLEIDNEEETNNKTDDGVVVIDMEKQRREEEIRKKLEKSRKERERLSLQNLEGKGLGDLLTEENQPLDVKAWLESSKSKQERALEEMEEEEEQKEEEKERRLKEVNASLAGMKVAHDITQIGEGDTILTLRDAPLINADGNINEEEDVLENIELVTQEKQKEINKQREKAKLPVYTGLDDHEFDSDYEEEDRFLPQYSEKKKKEVFFTLTETGVSENDLERSRQMAKERNKNAPVNPLNQTTNASQIGGMTEKKSVASLLSTITEKKIQTEYYTNEEMAQFKKKRKRVRKVRQIEKEDETPLKLEEIQDEEMTSRKRLHEAKKNEEDEEKRERAAGYQRAKEKEEIKNRGLSKKGNSGPVEDVYDDPLMSDTLLRARKVVLGQRKQTINEIAERIRKEREEEGVDEGQEGLPTGLEAVSEFSKRFKTIMSERKKEKEETQQVVEKPVEQLPVVVEEQQEEQKQPEQEDVEEEEDLYEQPNISLGLGSALAYLKAQNVTGTYEEAYGRRTDSVLDTSNNQDGFVIEHRDKDGRLLTTKEAFRQLSYQFHGKTPGQKNKARKNAKYTKGLANKGVY